MKYFSTLPKIITSNYNDGVIVLTNLLARANILPEALKNPLLYYTYDIQEGDTPEIIAHKYYGDSERHWIVLMFNDIVDPQFDWPMPYSTFINYVDQKYKANGAANTTSQTGLAWAMTQNNVQA